MRELAVFPLTLAGFILRGRFGAKMRRERKRGSQGGDVKGKGGEGKGGRGSGGEGSCNRAADCTG